MRILNAQHRVALCCVALFISSAAGLKAGPIAYEVSQLGQFGTIDLATGVITPIGTTVEAQGLGAYGGSVFLAGRPSDTTNTLYKVNPVDASLTLIGDPGPYWDWGGFGSTTNGLYAVGISDLFSINPLTGAATDIGPTGIGPGNALSSSNSSTLYFCQGSNLYTIDTSTGHATLVGAFGNGAHMYALLVVGGILYGADPSTSTIDTIDTTTGLATVLSSISHGTSPWGLAPGPEAPEVPEPGSAFLLTAGIVGLIVAKRPRRNPRTAPTH